MRKLMATLVLTAVGMLVCVTAVPAQEAIEEAVTEQITTESVSSDGQVAVEEQITIQEQEQVVTQAKTQDREVAVLETSEGTIVIAFAEDKAPGHVENFKKLAREGFYDGTAFHRVIKGFMMQGGCPNTKAGATGAPGTGGPGHSVKAEFNDRPHVKGSVSMARSNDPNSAGSQFFICFSEASFLNNQYTNFGDVIKGMDVVEKIETYGAPRDPAPPTKRIELKKVSIVKESELGQ